MFGSFYDVVLLEKMSFEYPRLPPFPRGSFTPAGMLNFLPLLKVKSVTGIITVKCDEAKSQEPEGKIEGRQTMLSHILSICL